MASLNCSWEAEAFVSNVNLDQDTRAALQRATAQEYLEILGKLALKPELSDLVFTYFHVLALELCAQWKDAELDVVTIACGHVLGQHPQLLPLVQRLLAKTNVNLLESVFSGAPGAPAYANSDDYPHITQLLLAVYRLLLFDNAAFASFIKPAPLQLLLQHPSNSIRYLSIRIICLFVHASDAVVTEMISKHIGNDASYGIWEGHTIDFSFLSLWEEKRTRTLRDERSRLQDSRPLKIPDNTLLRTIESGDWSPNVINIGGTLLLRAVAQSHNKRASTNLVATATTAANLSSVAKALEKESSILIVGPTGSGKTAAINYLATQLTSSSNGMITLHLNEQSDSKLLAGIYTSGSQPGSFEWQRGVLTVAVEEGRWVLIEDIDRAPNEVISTLLPLIERGELSIPSRGQTLRAAPGFRLIATMRSNLNLNGEEIAPVSRLLGNRLWSQVRFAVLTDDELRNIITSQYPILGSHLPSAMKVYQVLQNATQHKLVGALRSRPISSRDLLKWCGRTSDLLQFKGHKSGLEPISDHSVDAMFLDAVDCFLGSLTAGSERDLLVSRIAEAMRIDPQRKSHLLVGRTAEIKELRGGNAGKVSIGRVLLSVSSVSHNSSRPSTSAVFAQSRHSLRTLEQVAVAVQRREPLLLVGETGVGKTSAVQHLASMLGHKLVAINLSQQSESGDLLGGFKPVNERTLIMPLKEEFDNLFDRTFSSKKNEKFLKTYATCIAKGQWKRVLALWKEALKMADHALMSKPVEGVVARPGESERQKKRRKLVPVPADDLHISWDQFAAKTTALERRMGSSSKAFVFRFVEGKLIEAMRKGHWVLLDEINLASPDTLECLADVLESGSESRPSILLTETGNIERIEAHPEFRLFAAMNPATDVGKRDLSSGVRSRFTELYVESPDGDIQSLQAVVAVYLDRAISSQPDRILVARVAGLYVEIQRLVREAALVDGSGQPPHYSLRTLTRALTHAANVAPQCSMRRAIFEGFCMCFLTSLDNKSEHRVLQALNDTLWGDTTKAIREINKPIKAPEGNHFLEVIFSVESLDKRQKPQDVKHYLQRGSEPLLAPMTYIITPYVYRNLRNMMRAISARKQPVLVQGPTSAGKTSMVEYLAGRSGNKFVRINNHEHTDLSEYLGTYISTTNGQLVFQEGVLVQAVRLGHWIVLDELNLAPTDVLEALNRLLDDNRELFVPETQEVVRPHSNFMIFATQNPVGPYGGRKVLSRAFRNRFLELHFDDVPVEELNIILSRRSSLPESWCRLIVEVYKQLSRLRQEQRLFEQNSFATLRDLFRWAFRGADSIYALAVNGYMLLAEKIRKPEEQQDVRRIIESVMSRKGVKVNIRNTDLYTSVDFPEMALYDREAGSGIVWTKAMRRLYALAAAALRNNEPVLLVGETGCGKTTVCQMLARALRKPLHIVNAHQNMETGDLVGAQRPIRNRAAIEEELSVDLLHVLFELDATPTKHATLEELLLLFDQLSHTAPDVISESLRSRISMNRKRRNSLFEWHDGSLVRAMRSGHFYLLDEISLAEDSVLERMNSVLDPQRTVLLAEKGTEDSFIMAKEGFQFFATMNPGGDFGKKELSPALRNRFTEIWVPALTDDEDILLIVQEELQGSLSSFASSIVAFARWFSEHYQIAQSPTISIRDILAWIDFANNQRLEPVEAIVHGAAMIYIDALGANPASVLQTDARSIDTERRACLNKLAELLGHDAIHYYNEPIDVSVDGERLLAGPFSIPINTPGVQDTSFHFHAATPRMNTMRLVRALQLSKSILLEGNPGVGKTAIVAALAKVVGQPLTRINLSEQTDLMDLFGSDVPVENEGVGRFVWRDAPFLAAMKRGEWVLLDEMNLASQSILEGLNACLDHRGEIYVSELDQTFAKHPSFRLFAAQNPHQQGGGRKGLPASFVNRFTVVYADVLKQDDLIMISSRLFPSIASATLQTMVKFVSELDVETSKSHRIGTRGGPWEFNLRDTLRWLQALDCSQDFDLSHSPHDFLGLLFTLRFRTDADALLVRKMFDTHFVTDVQACSRYLNFSPHTLQIGSAFLQRSLFHQMSDVQIVRLQHRLHLMESLMHCVQHRWPVLLVGAAGAGKTHLLDSLAGLAGVKLEVFAMNADIDATDLVGGYEQADPARLLEALRRDLRAFAFRNLASKLVQSGQNSQSILTSLFGLLHYTHVRELDRHAVEEILVLLVLLRRHLHVSEIQSISHQCEGFLAGSQHPDMARFEWVDGILIRALERGSWLVLDNANLCSSSVLDRLNSLLEPGGSLIVNEHVSEDGNAKSVVPHPNFRVFLTMDPQYGEISRAMRNRAVELFVPPFAAETFETNQDILNNITLESSMSRFRMIVELGNVIQSGSLEVRADENELGHGEPFQQILIKLGLDRITLNDIPLLQRFHQQAEAGLMSGATFLLLSSAHETLVRMRQSSSLWEVKVLQYYNSIQVKRVGMTNFAVAQSIYTLTNDLFVLKATNRKASSDPHWLAACYEMMLDLHRMQQLINEITTQLPLPQNMNRLQRSVAAARLPQVTHDSTARVAPFLQRSIALLKNWIVECWAQDVQNLDMLKRLNEFLFLWWSLVKLVSTGGVFDEGLYRTFVTHAMKRVAMMTDAQNDRALPAFGLWQALKHLDASIQLQTGLVVDGLWPVLRPVTATSYESLQRVLQVEQFADRLDAAVSYGDTPLIELLRLRELSQKALELASIDGGIEFETLFEEARLVMESFTTSVEEASSKESVLCDVFERICQTLDLASIHKRSNISDRPPSDPLGNQLAVLAGRPTKKIWRRSENTIVSQILSRVPSWAGSTEAGHRHCLDVQEVSKYVMQSISDSPEVQIQLLHKLREEIAILGHAFAQRADQLCDDPIMQVKDTVRRLEEAIVEPFLASEDTANSSSAATVQPESAERLFVQRICNHHLDPSLAALKSSNTDATTIGKAIKDFALGALLLFVPDKPYDPALAPRLERSLYFLRKSQLEEKLKAIKLLEMMVSGQTSNIRSLEAQAEMESIPKPPPEPLVARPPVSELRALQTEFTGVLNIVQRISADGDQDYLDTIGNALENISRSMSRLDNGFAAYRDLTLPVVGLLSCLKIGLVLQYQHTEDTNRKDELKSIVSEGPLLGMVPEAIWNDLSTICFEASSIERLYLATKGLALRSAIVRPARWPLSTKTLLTNLFNSFFARWKSQLASDQKKEASASSLYTYRGGKDVDDEADEDELAELFPTYEDSGSQSKNNPGPGRSPQTLASTVANLHFKIFIQDLPILSQAHDVLTSTLSLLTERMKDMTGPDPLTLDQAHPALLLALRQTQDQLRPQPPSSTYNAYTDANLAEVSKLITVIQEIRRCFKPILDTWPEHSTLHNVFAACAQILSFRHTEPIMKVLTKAEQLHGYIAEWQTVASREYSATGVYNKLTDLLISWRQIELSTWSRLLDLESRKSEEEARSWWFVAYENVIINSAVLYQGNGTASTDLVDLASTLQAFIANSTMGQFAQRLNMLESLCCQVNFISSEGGNVSQVIRNMLSHFSRFSRAVADAITGNRQMLEKEVKNLILLASWKDRNINSLKQSAKSSHRKLFNIIRKFRKALSQPVSSILLRDPPIRLSAELHRQESSPRTASYLREAMEICSANTTTWNMRPARFKTVEATVSLIRRRLGPYLEREKIDNQLDEFIANFQGSVDHLQKATPAVRTKENETTIKNLTRQKKKLLADSLKDIRAMGLKANNGSDMLDKQSSLGKVIAAVPALDLSKFSPSSTSFQGDFDWLLDMMPLVRQASAEQVGGLNQAEISRSIGYLESFLALCTKQRTCLGKEVSDFETIETSVLQIESCWDSSLLQVLPDIPSSSNYPERVAWLPTILRLSNDALRAQSEMGQIDFSSIIKVIPMWADECDSLHHRWSNFAKMPLGTTSRMHKTWQNDSEDFFSKVQAQVSIWIEENPLIRHTLRKVVPWLNFDEDPHATSINGQEALEVQQYMESQYQCLDQILSSVQSIETASQSRPNAEPEDRWLSREDDFQTTVLASFHAHNVAQSIRGLLDELHTVRSDEGVALEIVCASLTASLPIMVQYRDALREAIDRYALLHTATCHAASRLAKTFIIVAERGFCNPAEASEEKASKSENLESGTGLGEGEGAEDISKDVEDDEDLSELAQDPSNKNKEGGIENEDDAVDVQEQLEGAEGEEALGDDEADASSRDDAERDDGVESMGDGGGEESGGDGREDEEPTEENVGNVDDLGLSAADEKLWDEAGDEADKEKEGNREAGDRVKDDQAAGRDVSKKEQEEGEAQDEVGHGDDGNDEALSDMSDADGTGQPETESMDPHLKESEGLDLPEELQLDGDNNDKGSVSDAEINGDDEEEAGAADDLGTDDGDVLNGSDGEEQENEATHAGDPSSRETDMEDEVVGQDQGLQPQDDRQADGDQDDTDFDNEPGSGQANDATADDKKMQNEEMEARGTGLDDAPEQQSSESSARRSNGAQSQNARDKQNTMDDGTERQTTNAEETRAEETVRKLGDVLEKWHRQQRKIQESTSNKDTGQSKEQDVEMADADFEHLPDNDADADTQALGSATKDEVNPVDESMAIPSELQSIEQQNRDDFLPDVDEPLDESSTLAPQSCRDETSRDQGYQPEVVVGQKKETSLEDIMENTVAQPDDEPVSNVSSDLLAMALEVSQPSLLSAASAQALWQFHEGRTHSLSQALTAQLRLILAPTLATKLRGDFRTGKRLNIKRIIPYIASQYKRDRIWMRRSVPSKRAYQILIALDDSKSMADDDRAVHGSVAGDNGPEGTHSASKKSLAFDTLALVANSLSSLEAGQLGLLAFGSDVTVAHDLSSRWSPDGSSGAAAFRHFTFGQTRTDVKKLIGGAIEIFRDARLRSQGGGGGGQDLWQLMLVVGDGICEDHEGIGRLLLEAIGERILVVFVIVDSGTNAGGEARKTSIFDLEKVEFIGDGDGDDAAEMKLVRKKYLDTFPFQYFLIVKDVKELPAVLATALRQWFAEVAER